MNAPPRSFRSRFASSHLAVAVAVLAVGLLALLNALPHMHDPIWQDEAATLLNFTTTGWRRALFDYRSPNNHILFSAMMAAWLSLWRNGVDVFALRLLPLLTYLAAVPVLMLAARRMAGRAGAVVAGLLFAVSAVAANFATQLRGYGPSWLFVAGALLCALHAADGRRVSWRTGYVLACVGAVWMVPSNLPLMLATGIAVALYLVISKGWRADGVRNACVVLALGPFLGLLGYAGVFERLLEHGRIALSDWSRFDLAMAWVQGALLDFWYLLPAIAAGLALGAKQAWQGWRAGDREPTAQLALVLALLAAVGGVIVVMPNTPFPRTLVPFLPAWLCALAWCIAQLLRAIPARRDLRLAGATALAAAALMLPASPLPACRGATSARSELEYDLCYQFFRDHYQPEAVAVAWLQLGRPDLPIATDYEGFFSLKVLGVPGLNVYEYRAFPNPYSGPAPLVVVHSNAEARQMLGQLPVGGTRYVLVADTGYFQVYGAEEQAEPVSATSKSGRAPAD
jgi:hypothetical protein